MLIYLSRSSRERRVIENAFGILAARWRIFRQPNIAKAENALEHFTKACILLHNYLIEQDPQYIPKNLCRTIPGGWLLN